MICLLYETEDGSSSIPSALKKVQNLLEMVFMLFSQVIQ